MTTISRINTTINDHTLVVNTIAFCFVAFGVIAWVATINQYNNLARSYDAILQPTFAAQAPAKVATTSKIQTTQQTSGTALTVSNSSPLSLQNQPQDIITQLQPAENLTYNSSVTANTLQPSTNNMQLTDANLQNATASIQ